MVKNMFKRMEEYDRKFFGIINQLSDEKKADTKEFVRVCEQEITEDEYLELWNEYAIYLGSPLKGRSKLDEVVKKIEEKYM